MRSQNFLIEKGVLVRYTGYKTMVEIPEEVTEIGRFAFHNNPYLKAVRLPKGLKAIGQEAFQLCRQLERLELPESVTVIGESAFYGCTCLEEINIPAGVTEIGDQTFGNCRSLTQIRFPEGLRTIGKYAFRGNRLREVTIPASVTSIGDGAFIFGRTLSKVSILGAVTELGESVFEDCHQLEAVFAPKVPWAALKKANMLAVAARGYLEHYEVYEPELWPYYHKYIASQKRSLLPRIFREDLVAGVEAYAKAGKLHVKNIQKDFLQPAIEAGATQCVAFLMDWQSKNITPEEAEKQWTRELNRDPYCAEDMKKLWACQKREDGTWVITGYKGTETELYIPPRIGRTPVTAIGEEAFYSDRSGRLQAYRRVLEKVTAVTIPEGVTSIGEGAFRSCKELQEINIPSSVVTIGAKAFAGCSQLQTLHIPEGVTTIGDSAFYSCEKLTTLMIPKSVTGIGKNAMRKCPGLTVRVREGSFAVTCMKRRKIPFVVE